MKRIAVLLADGFEEIEATTVIDVLRRAGCAVEALGVTGLEVRGAQNLCLRCDKLLRDVEGAWDAVVVPGGAAGAETLRDSLDAQAFLRMQPASTLLAAICAGPIALAQAGALRGLRATCYPGFETQLQGATFVNATVVQDGRVITSRGVGTALPFALALAARLGSQEAADALAARMLVRPIPNDTPVAEPPRA